MKTLVAGLAVACSRTTTLELPSPSPATSTASPSRPAVTAIADAAAEAPPDAAVAWEPPEKDAIDGPHQDLSLEPGRPIFWAASARDAGAGPSRLVAHIHGMCGPPTYACGKWIGAGTGAGVMVCPTGNARCGDSPVGPPSWEAPTWPELVGAIDKDLEAAIAKVDKKHHGLFGRDDAVLTGYSRGAFAAPVLAGMHPNRWRYLVLIEANAPLTAAGLRRAGVRAVALVAGEQGTEIAGMRKTATELEDAGFPARLFTMRRTGHLYSDDMEHVMHDALTFVLSNAS